MVLYILRKITRIRIFPRKKCSSDIINQGMKFRFTYSFRGCTYVLSCEARECRFLTADNARSLSARNKKISSHTLIRAPEKNENTSDRSLTCSRNAERKAAKYSQNFPTYKQYKSFLFSFASSFPTPSFFFFFFFLFIPLCYAQRRKSFSAPAATAPWYNPKKVDCFDKIVALYRRNAPVIVSWK